MAISFEGRLMWRRSAPFHVQLELNKASYRELPSGPTEVHGVVVRVFRTDGRLTAGDHVEFELWVCRSGNVPTGPAFIYEEEFARAVYMEVYLAGTPPKCDLAGYEFCVLDAPSDRPMLTPEELEELEKTLAWGCAQKMDDSAVERRRWQFWKRKGSAS